MEPKKTSRTSLAGAAALLVGLFLAWSFWPRATSVTVGEAVVGPMMVTIDEEARTRVRDAYVVSAPMAGRLLRVEVEPGDVVEGGTTVLARLRPTSPDLLDARAAEQARANVDAATAALAYARSDVERARADADYASLEFERIRKLHQESFASREELDRAERALRAQRATLETANAAVAMRQAELVNARAMLQSFPGGDGATTDPEQAPQDLVPLTAPISGKVLRTMQESESVIAAGSAILEIGDTDEDLEIVAELLSTDAVAVSPGDEVLIEKWGGGRTLQGEVERVEPWGFTKFSALGVEEQRVNTIIRFVDPPERRGRLGHGFRVEVRIVTWKDDRALHVPSSALFREGRQWAVLRLDGHRVRKTVVEAGHNNGFEAEILDGLEAGDRVVLYPGAELTDGSRVDPRTH